MPKGSVKTTGQQVGDKATAAARMMGRSRVTNAAARGSVLWLDHTDKRGPMPRRFRDIVGEVTNDLGGPSQLSESQRQIVKRIASLSIWCESMECRMADGEDIDILMFGRTANSLRRLCESVGLRRVPRDITPDLDTYLRTKYSQAEDAELEDA